MGPQRQNWSFPYSGAALIERILEQELEITVKIDNQLAEEQLAEQKLAEFRDQMRQAGVIGWELMQLPPAPPWGTYRGTLERSRDYYGRLAKKLLELQRYRRALERDVERDPHRTFKLTHDDLEFLDF